MTRFAAADDAADCRTDGPAHHHVEGLDSTADSTADSVADSVADVDEQAANFDDTDGAYAIAEPDPFTDAGPNVRRLSHERASLRAELRTGTREPTAGGTGGLLHSVARAVAGPLSGLSRPAVPPLPVPESLSDLLPHGLRRGSSLAVTSSVSLLLALLGTASAEGAWIALVGMPAISAEAAVEAGVALNRVAVISPPEPGWNTANWTTAVGALLDAVDIVVARPGVTGATAVSDGDTRRLTARARTKDAVLVLFGQQAASWPALEVQLSARHGRWQGIGDGYGRLTSRQLLVTVSGKGRSARPHTAELWLPAHPAHPVAAHPVVAEFDERAG
ncbi:hypothetical protein M6D93_06045 [Jatrophihabitans telluris]|uniref:Uncharacterized protein n=1 Tax=Jatrophihabitans telluris TaxID=2038343 RepID=A0ABY4R339_9ACTN|nr:hypothetical protein [Jatrophihabitans telluris]UQX89565.1 hypothetical protein M6D93_06045 [Jatrophihabitans telluris]